MLKKCTLPTNLDQGEMDQNRASAISDLMFLHLYSSLCYQLLPPKYLLPNCFAVFNLVWASALFFQEPPARVVSNNWSNNIGVVSKSLLPNQGGFDMISKFVHYFHDLWDISC